MIDEEGDINLDKIVFVDNNQERNFLNCLGDIYTRPLIVSLSQIFVIFWLSLAAFEDFVFQKLATNQQCGCGFCVVKQDTFYPHQACGQANFYKKSRFYFNATSVRDGRVITYLQVAQNWNLSTKNWQENFFKQYSQPLYDVMQKEIENLEFVQSVNFEFVDSLKNNDTKYLLIFWRLVWTDFHSKGFADFVATGRHREFSCIYIKHNLFYRSKVAPDVELQNTHTAHIKSPCCYSSRYV